MGTGHKIKGTTELIAAIYDPELLPSAIIVPTDATHRPFCVHSVRTGNMDFFNKFIGTVIGADEDSEFIVYKFFEDYPSQEYTCLGCHYLETMGLADESHDIVDSAAVCTKTTEDCA